ncbi:DNA-binding transcriptional activator GcvA [compost metagenome]
MEKLLDDVFFPMCSPGFNGGRLPQKPEEMAGLPLLRGEGDPWKPWFEAAGLDWSEPR